MDPAEPMLAQGSVRTSWAANGPLAGMTSEVRAGRLDELKAAIAELTRFVEANEPRLLAMHINPDLASLQFHMGVAGPLFRPIGEFITMLSIDVRPA